MNSGTLFVTICDVAQLATHQIGQIGQIRHLLETLSDIDEYFFHKYKILIYFLLMIG